ncbi:MAG: TonB-dependent receptor [Alphaproteobacteria bacterium]|nr:TonB-dependent receptor [Alphaproteobacteria bacterium]
MQSKFVTALLAASALVTPAFAQDAQDEFIVTATRVETTIRNLPADVTVIDTDAALSRGQTTVAQALEDTPGLGVIPSGGLGQQTSLFAGGANSYHTLVLFDGLRLNDPSTPNSSFDAGQDQINGLTRLEVVEGPMSAVFGSDAIGGVINMIPRHGGEGPLNARLDFSAGSFETLNAAAGIDGTLGNFRYAITGEGFTTDGYDLVPERMVTHTGDEDGAESSAVTGVFDLQVTQNFSLDLLARHRESRADIDVFDFEFGFPFRETRIDSPDAEIGQNDLTLARLGATWNLSDALSLRATFGGLDQDRVSNRFGALTDSFSGERRFADLTLNWQANDVGGLSDVAFVAGIAAEREKADIAQGFGFPPPFLFTRAEQDQTGAFITAQGRSGALSLTGAVRVDDFEGFGTQTTWRLGASYDVTERARAYGSFGTSFRAPSLYERYSSAGVPDLDPEQGVSWEIGADARFAAFGQDQGLELSTVYRHTELEDMIDFAGFTYANVDQAEIDTAELRAAIRPTSWLTLHGGYIYTDAQDTAANTELLRRPQDVWLASAEVKQNAFTGRLSWRSVGERQDFQYGDDSFGAVSPPFTGAVPGYDVVGASLSYDFSSNVTAYVAADNALDETYEAASGIASAPRAITVGLRLRAGSN